MRANMVGGTVARQAELLYREGRRGGLLLAIFAAPRAIVVLLGLELLEHRLFESGPAAKGGGPIRAGSATATAMVPPPL